VGQAAEEATRKGPLGHPVVDVAVTLLDGGFHSVDSSDMAFATATRMAMQEGLAKADPVLLEPVEAVTVSVPAEATPAAQRLLTGRRGQILGFAAKPGWEGWDEVQALVPGGGAGRFHHRAAVANPGPGQLHPPLRPLGGGARRSLTAGQVMPVR
jgi:elongation factor G